MGYFKKLSIPPRTAPRIKMGIRCETYFDPDAIMDPIRRTEHKNLMAAAKDIWKPGDISVSGRRRRTITAAMATERSVIARRSRSTAQNITATWMKARSVATFPPESAR